MSSNVPLPRLRNSRFFDPSLLLVTYRSDRPSRSTSTTETAAPIDATCGMMCASFGSSVGAPWIEVEPGRLRRFGQPEAVLLQRVGGEPPGVDVPAGALLEPADQRAA